MVQQSEQQSCSIPPWHWVHVLLVSCITLGIPESHSRKLLAFFSGDMGSISVAKQAESVL